MDLHVPFLLYAVRGHQEVLHPYFLFMYSLFPDTFHFLPFKSSSVLTIFHEIVENECKRECVSRIAKTLLYYTNNHIFDESVGAKDCDDIVEFIRRATSPETAETYMTKMADNSASASTPRSKRKLTAFTKMTIEPILVELQALLSIPRLRSAIRLVQHMDATPKISPEDKRQGWFQLLDFFHQKGMLLDEEKNANFHSLTVGSETGLNSILQFFQGIVNGIMDDIGDAMEKRGSAITDEEEDWIRLHQLKVRQTVLKFCMRRAAFSSNPLTVACSVSGLECKEDAYFDGSPQKEAVSKKMDDILSFRIEPRDRPLCLGGPIREDEVGLIENQHEAEAQIDEAEETERQAIAAEKYSRNQWEEIVPASPANVPFMAINVDDTDIEEDEEVEDEEARNETFDIVVESDEKSTGEGGAEILSDTDNSEIQETGEDIAKDDEESINSEDNEDQDIVEIDSDSNEDQPLNEQPYSNNYVHSSDEDQQADQHIDDSGKQYDGVDRFRQEDDDSDGSEEFYDGVDRSRQEDDYSYSDGSQEFHDGIDRSRQEDVYSDGSQEFHDGIDRSRQEDDDNDGSQQDRIVARRPRQEDDGYSDQSEEGRIDARRSRQEDIYSDQSEQDRIVARRSRQEDDYSDGSEEYDANHHGRTERRIEICEEIDERSDRSEQYDANQHGRTERRIQIGEEIDESSDRSEQYDANHHGRTERRIAIGEEIDESSDRSEQYDANQHSRTERRIEIGEEVDEHSDRSEQYDGDTAEHDYDRNLDESYIDESGGNTDDEADSVIEVIDSCEDERDDESTAEEMSPQDANQSSDAFNGSNDIVAEGNHRADEDQNVEESNRLDSEHVDASNETIQKSNNTRPEVESMESISKETNDECANSVVMEDIEDAEHIQFEDRADTNRFAEEIELGRPKNHEAASDFVDTVDDAETQTDNKIRDQDGEEVEAEDETDFKDASSDEAKSDDLEVADDAETQIDQNNYEDKDIEEKEEVEIGPIQATSEAVKVAGESEVDVQTDDRSVGDRDAAEKEETASVKDTRPNEAALDVIEVANYSQAESDHSIDENIDDTETDDKLEDSIVGEHAGDNSSDDAASGDTGVASDVEAETDDRTQDPVVEKEDAASIKNTSPDYIADDVEAETDDRTQDPVIKKEDAASIKDTSPDYVADDVEAETDDRTQDPVVEKEEYPGGASPDETASDAMDASDDMEAQTDDKTDWDREIEEVEEKDVNSYDAASNAMDVSSDIEAQTNDRTDGNRGIENVEIEDSFKGTNPDQSASDVLEVVDDAGAEPDDRTDRNTDVEENNETNVEADSKSEVFDTDSEATEEKEVNISVDQQHLNGVAVEPIIDEATSELDADLTGDAEIPPEEHAEENDKPSKIDNIGEILIGNKAEMTGTLSLQEAPSEHEHPDEAEAEDDAKSNEGGEEDAGGASLVDSGGASDDKTTEGGDDYSTYTFNELRKACKSKGISAQGKAVALRERLKKAAEAPSPDDQEVPVNALPEVGFEEAKDEDDYSTTSFRELRTPVQGKIDELRERLRENDGISSKVPPEDADADDVEDDLSTASYRELQQECKRRGLNAGGKRGDLVSRLNGGKMQGSIAGDVSHAIKEEDSEENSSVEEVLTKEQEFARICSQAAEKEIKKKSIPRAIKIQEPVVQNEPMTSPIASMLKAAGNFVAKGLDMMSPTKRKRKAEVIDLLDSDNDEAKEETNADELSPLRNPVPKNITAGAVFSPGDQSVISTLSAADHNNLEAPRRTRPGVKRKMGGRPPILKRQKVEEGENIRSDATELPKRKTRSNSAVSSIRSTRSKRSGTSAKKTASNSAASSVRSTRSATRSQTGAKKK